MLSSLQAALLQRPEIKGASHALQASCEPSCTTPAPAQVTLASSVLVRVVTPARASTLRQQPKPLDGAASPRSLLITKLQDPQQLVTEHAVLMY